MSAETVTPARVSRPDVVNSLLDLYDNPRYLEVGVNRGGTFNLVEAAEKVAVDPQFLFDVEDARRANPRATYHQVPSDAYFGSIIQPDERFDVVFLDGLHTVEQTLRDLLNVLPYVQPRGVLVIDDVRPSSYHASLPDQSECVQVRKAGGFSGGDWMGDVYRLIWFIDSFLQGLTYRTVANNHGQTVLWRQRRTTVNERQLADVANLSYADMVMAAEVLRLRPLDEIVNEFRAHRDAGT